MKEQQNNTVEQDVKEQSAPASNDKIIVEEEKTYTMQELRQQQLEKEREEYLAKTEKIKERREAERSNIERERREREQAKFDQKKSSYDAIFEKYLAPFEPKEIGFPDITKSNEIERKYLAFCNLLNDARLALANYFQLEEKSSMQMLIDFIKSNPADWLPKQYILLTKTKTPDNINLDKIIELKLVDFPDTSEMINLHRSIIYIWKEVKSWGFISLKNLYNAENDSFELTPLFFELQDDFLIKRTTTAEQNVVLRIIEKLHEAIIELDSLQIIQLRKGIGDFIKIQHFFKFKGGSISINPYIFIGNSILQKFGDVQTGKGSIHSLDEFLS